MIGCLCIHGFTGSPYEVEPLVNYLKKRTDWLISVPTLPGHGETLQLKGVHYLEWIETAEANLKKLLDKCDTVYVIGFSMGGMIASYLAVHYPVSKLVLLSAAALYLNPKKLTLDIKDMIYDGFRGNIKENELYQRYKKKIQFTPISATIQFRRLVQSIRPLLKDVEIPTFIAQGTEDGIVPPKSAQYLYSQLGSSKKNLKYFEGSKHLICHCDDNIHLFDHIYDFLKNV